MPEDRKVPEDRKAVAKEHEVNENVKLGTGVVGGYLLGRTKKGKLALRLAFWAATRNSGLRPGELASRLARELRDSPEIADALVGVRRELGDVGRRLAGDALGRQLDVLADRLHDRTEQRRQEMAGSDQGRPSGDDSTGDDSTGRGSTGEDSDDRAASGGDRDRADSEQEQESGAQSSDEDAQSGKPSEVEDGAGGSDNASADTTASNEAS